MNANDGEMMVMYNSLGEIVLSKRMVKGGNLVDVSLFADGIYFVELGENKRTKIVVQH